MGKLNAEMLKIGLLIEEIEDLRKIFSYFVRKVVCKEKVYVPN